MTFAAQSISGITTTGRLAAAATLTAGLVATSAAALVVIGGGTDPASAAVAPRANHGLGIAGTSAHRTPTATPSRSIAPAHPVPSFSSSPVALRTSAPPAPVTYRVKPGDNLTAIARWFKMHGYEQLYLRNRAAIGADPNLIRPGQLITVTPQGSTVSMSVTPAP